MISFIYKVEQEFEPVAVPLMVNGTHYTCSVVILLFSSSFLTPKLSVKSNAIISYYSLLLFIFCFSFPSIIFGLSPSLCFPPHLLPQHFCQRNLA